MTVHDLGYRGWSGQLAPTFMRPLVIANTGVRRSWQSRWLRRILFFAWLPTLWYGLGFFIWEQSLLNPQWSDALRPFLSGVPETSPLGELLQEANATDSTAARHGVWAWLLQSFFHTPQGVGMALVVGMIAPSLISQDIRSRAFLLYFSRPLARSEYILGKFMTVWFYLVMITALPALSLYILGILLSPQLDVVQATWDLPLRILAASAVLMIPTASLALCLSSLTQESRYAGFAWFAIWILGWFTYSVMIAVQVTALQAAEQDPTTFEAGWWMHLSFYHTLGQVQRWVFGFEEFGEVLLSMVVLSTLTVVSLLVLFRRVAAPMRV